MSRRPPDQDLAELLAKRAEIDASLAEHAVEMAVLFSDIKGSTQYFEEKGDIEGMVLLKRHNDLLFPIIGTNRGRIVKTIGDAIMAVFDSPVDGARCGAEMQRALEREAAETKKPRIHIRIGVHFGKVMRQGNDVFGDTVNTASRIEHNAVPDEVLISKPVADALGGSVELRDRGSVAAKGKAEPVPVLSLVWGPGAPKAEKVQPKTPTAAGAVPAAERASPAELTPTRTPAGSAPEAFILELQVGANGLKVSALDGAADKGTVKAYDEVPITPDGLARLAEPFATFMTGGGGDSYVERIRDFGIALYDKAFTERVQRRLRGTHVSFLRLHLDDDLIQVPWELAHDGTDFLALRFAAGRMVAARAKTSPGFAMPELLEGGEPIAVVVSNPSGDLPAAAAEGKAVAGLLRDGYRGSVKHLEGPVTTAAFLAALRGATILHFAGHAERGGGNVRGGFRLADGIVSPEQVAAAVGQRAPALVFANSCHATGGAWTETAQGVFGLASSLLMRGAQHYIGPMWQIPDADALAFSLRFYEQALSGVAFGQAVRGARRSLLESHAAPLSFAGYVLYGEPRTGFPMERVKLAPGAQVRSAGAVAIRAATIAADAFTSAVDTGSSKGARRKPFIKTTAGRSVIAGAAVLGTAAAAGELAVSVQTLFGSGEPAAAVGTAVPGATQVAMVATAIPTPAAMRHTGPVRVAVMPFKNLGDGEANELQFTLQEAGIDELGLVTGLSVIERGQIQGDTGVLHEIDLSNTPKYWDPEASAAYGKQLGAEVVVLGGYQKSGQVIRLNARFVNVETGEVLHSLKVDRPVKRDEDIFKLQDAFSEEVAKAAPVLKDKLRPKG